MATATDLLQTKIASLQAELKKSEIMVSSSSPLMMLLDESWLGRLPVGVLAFMPCPDTAEQK